MINMKGRTERETAAGNRRGKPRKLPALSGMPVPGGVEHREAPERLPLQRKPHGSCGSLEDPLVSGLVNDPGMPVRSVMVRPDAEGSSMRGDEWGRKLLRQPGDDVLRRGLAGLGTTAVEPGRKGSSAFESAELSTSYSSEFETVEHRGRRGARGAATRFWPVRSKGPDEQEPHERQRTQRVRKAGGRSNRRGGEKPRGRMVPGRGRPGSYRSLR